MNESMGGGGEGEGITAVCCITERGAFVHACAYLPGLCTASVFCLIVSRDNRDRDFGSEVTRFGKYPLYIEAYSIWQV